MYELWNMYRKNVNEMKWLDSKNGKIWHDTTMTRHKKNLGIHSNDQNIFHRIIISGDCIF